MSGQAVGGRQSGPDPLPVVIFAGLCEDRQTVSDQFNRVAFAVGRVVGVLPNSPGDVDQVSLVDLGRALDQSAEDRHFIPVGVGDPLAIFLAVVIGGDRNLRHLVMLCNLVDAANDAKFSDVLHGTFLLLDQANS